MKQAHTAQRGSRSLTILALTPLLALALAALLAGCGGPQQQGQWELMGPTDGRQVESLTSDPHLPTRVYAAADDGKVYRVIADSTGSPSPGVGIPNDTLISSVFADSSVTGRIYAGTSAGLYLSRDYGDTWTRFGVGLPSSDACDAFAESPDGATLLAATSAHGVYFSHDGGAHWQASVTGLPSGADVASLLWFPTTVGAQTVYAGLTGGGVYVSADGGKTWTASSAGLPAKSNVNALAALGADSFAPQGPTLFAGTGSGLYDSIDGGKTWRQEGAGLPPGKVLSLFSFPTYPGWIFAGTPQGVYLSPNGGHTWRVPATGLEQPAISVLASPSKQASYVVFAASGQLARFPSAAGVTSPLNQIISVILIVLLLGLCFYFFYVRQRRYSALLARQEHAGPTDGAGGQRYVYVPLYGPDATSRKKSPAEPDQQSDVEAASHQENTGSGPGSLATSAKRMVSSTATNTRRKMRGIDQTAKPNKLPDASTDGASVSEASAPKTSAANSANSASAHKRIGKSSGKSNGGKRPNSPNSGRLP